MQNIEIAEDRKEYYFMLPAQHTAALITFLRKRVDTFSVDVSAFPPQVGSEAADCFNFRKQLHQKPQLQTLVDQFVAAKRKKK